ncbi:MAG: hypothetical protein ACT4P7_21465 [Gemmatimonadaceae bacterium]
MTPRLSTPRTVAALCLWGLAACGGAPAQQAGGSSALPPARMAAPGSLARFAAERVIVLPAQGIASMDPLGWRAKAGADRAVLALVDSTVEAQLRERGLASWVFASALARSAKRNPTYLTDPYAIRATGAVRVAQRSQERSILEPLSSQLRGLAGASDARWALIPLEVQYTPEGPSGRVRLALAMIDVRAAQLIWMGDVSSDPHADYAFAAIEGVVQRAADLIAPR